MLLTVILGNFFYLEFLAAGTQGSHTLLLQALHHMPGSPLGGPRLVFSKGSWDQCCAMATRPLINVLFFPLIDIVTLCSLRLVLRPARWGVDIPWMNGTMLFLLGPQALVLSLGQLVMWKARLCSTLKKVTFWECGLWPKEFKSRHAWNMCSFTDKVCNSEQ